MEKYEQTPHQMNSFPEIAKHIKFSGRSSSEVERQITVCRYETSIRFNFENIVTASKKCFIKPGDELGIIDLRTSSDIHSHEQNISNEMNEDTDSELDLGGEWVRALFGLISEKYFRWLDLETRDIQEFMIEGVLSETFLTEYYRNSDNDELEFLTYGGSRREERIKAKHRKCFGMHFGARLVEFQPEFVRDICLKPEFRKTLQEIGYAPLGQAQYGTVDEAKMKTKYSKLIDPNAKRVKEILEDKKIEIIEFSARVTVNHPNVNKSIKIRFHLTQRGRVTLYLPQIKFRKQLNQVERENLIYDIVKRAYAGITRGNASSSYRISKIPVQLTMDAFLGEVL